MLSFKLISFFHQPCHYFQQNLCPYNPSLIGRLHEIKSVCQQAIKRIIFSRFTTQRRHKNIFFQNKMKKRITRQNLILFRSFFLPLFFWMSPSELSFVTFCILFQHSVRRYRWIHGHFIDILRSRLGENSEWTFCTLRSIGRGEFCIKLSMWRAPTGRWNRKMKKKQHKINTKNGKSTMLCILSYTIMRLCSSISGGEIESLLNCLLMITSVILRLS